MEFKVTAVIVTFNRYNLLKECLRGIRKQTFKVNEIIVVNNGSTDGSLEWLIKQKDIRLINQSNLGAAGGFYSGLFEAYTSNNSNWFWLMDDDVEPEPDCLANQLEYSNFSECIHPLRRYLDNVDVKWEQIWDLQSEKRIQLNNQSFANGKDFCFVNVGCFEGMLISRRIVSIVGFPDPRFFIVNDDTVYGYLISLYTNVLYVKKAIIVRKKFSFQEVLNNNFIYYNIRNKHLILELLSKEYSNVNLFYIHLKYFIQEFKLLVFLMLTTKYSFSNKRKFLFSLGKGKIDFFRKKIGK